jgi:hypothetical protein
VVVSAVCVNKPTGGPNVTTTKGQWSADCGGHTVIATCLKQ